MMLEDEFTRTGQAKFTPSPEDQLLTGQCYRSVEKGKAPGS